MDIAGVAGPLPKTLLEKKLRDAYELLAEIIIVYALEQMLEPVSGNLKHDEREMRRSNCLEGACLTPRTRSCWRLF